MKYKHANYEMTVYGDKNNHGQKDALNYEDGYASSYGNQKGMKMLFCKRIEIEDFESSASNSALE